LQAVEILDQAGLVTNKPFFYALAVAKGAVRAIRSGEYEFTGGVTPLEILDALVQGKVKHYLVTFPEDITARDMAARLAALRLVQEEEFLALTRDRAFLASLSIEGDTAEGYLYPETYRLERTMGAREIMAVMVRQFWKVVTPRTGVGPRAGHDPGPGRHPGSLIGRETGHTRKNQRYPRVSQPPPPGHETPERPHGGLPLKGFPGLSGSVTSWKTTPTTLPDQRPPPRSHRQSGHRFHPGRPLSGQGGLPVFCVQQRGVAHFLPRPAHPQQGRDNLSDSKEKTVTSTRFFPLDKTKLPLYSAFKWKVLDQSGGEISGVRVQGSILPRD
jgi:hypothetical protein